jgi:hypothetical protein
MSTSRFEFGPSIQAYVDPESVLTFTLPEDSYVLAIYNASNRHGSVEAREGKLCYLNVDGLNIPGTWAEQGAYRDNSSSNITCMWVGRLPAGTHTIKAKVDCYGAGVCGIDVRQMIVLAVPVSVGQLVYGSSDLLGLTCLTFHETFVRASPFVEETAGLVGTEVCSDPLAVQRLDLKKEANVLIMYNACRLYGSCTAAACIGFGAVVSVDGVPVLESACARSLPDWDPGWWFATKATSVAFTRLGPGVHTLSGGFFPSRSCMGTRTLAYVVVPDEWISAGRMSSVRVEGNSSTMGSPPPWDDPEAVVTVDLPEDSKCLVVYGVANSSYIPGPFEEEPTPIKLESIEGKFTLINIDGVDMDESFASQSAGLSNRANHVLSLWAGRLTAGSHTIKGRWGSNVPDETTGIDRRVIAVICIPESLLI